MVCEALSMERDYRKKFLFVEMIYNLEKDKNKSKGDFSNFSHFISLKCFCVNAFLI